MDIIPEVTRWKNSHASQKYKRKHSDTALHLSQWHNLQVLSESPKLQLVPSPLNNVVLNVAQKKCIGCWDVLDMVIDFRCYSGVSKCISEDLSDSDTEMSTPLETVETHVACRECFENYALGNIQKGKIKLCPEQGMYTIPCPLECTGSFVKIGTFEDLLEKEVLEKYHRLCALRYAEDVFVSWCPYPDCQQGALQTPRSMGKRRKVSGDTSMQSPGLNESLPMSAKMTAISEYTVVLKGSSIMELIQKEQQEKENEEAKINEPLQHFSQELSVLCKECKRPVCILCNQGHDQQMSCQEFDKKNKLDSLVRDSTKTCPNCGVPICKDGGCNHMTCAACGYQFCWLHLTPWVEGGDCQRNHWATTTGLTTFYNVKYDVLNSVAHAIQRCSVM